MPYKITIKDNDTKSDIAGVVYMYDSDGNEIGLTTIPKGGADISENIAFGNTAHLEVNADGYYSYGMDSDQLYELTIVSLIKKGRTWVPYLIGGLLFYIGTNVFGRRSKRKKLF